jgi:Glu-tRNA(Gln) amidotransferase subunit E-like FAD-binding protein
MASGALAQRPVPAERRAGTRELTARDLTARDLTAGELRRLWLPDTRSRILARTGGHLWAFAVHGGRGLFSKEEPESRRRGRALCDMIIERYACDGFFTTDELPRYGLGRRDRDRLLADYGANNNRDVLVLLAYDDPRMVEDIRDDLLAALSSGPPAG